MIKARRKIIKHGDSKTITLPAQLYTGDVGSEVSLVANRLILVDPRGEISEDDLLHFFETVIEPAFHPWYRKLKGEWKNKTP